MEGTPAFDALQADREHKVTKMDKHVKRHLRKVPRPKRVLKGAVRL